MDAARAHLDALPWWRWRVRTNAQWRLEQAELHALRLYLFEPPEQSCPRHTWLVTQGIRDEIITAAELAAARPPQPLSQRPGVDPALTEDQLQALHGLIGTKGFEYFFVTYTDAEGWATDHGPLPSAVVAAWRAYEQAHEQLAALLGLTRMIRVRSHSPGVDVDPGLTDEQLEALHDFIDSKGFDYFFTTYFDAEGWAAEHGHLPPPVIEAWREFTRTHEKLATLIGVRS